MADQKISELTAATSAASADLFNIVQGGSNNSAWYILSVYNATVA
jgi:hypothetical protein